MSKSVHHIDGDIHNNDPANLRIVPHGSGFGLANLKREGTTNLLVNGEWFEVDPAILAAIGLRQNKSGRYLPRKRLEAFIAGAQWMLTRPDKFHG